MGGRSTATAEGPPALKRNEPNPSYLTVTTTDAKMTEQNPQQEGSFLRPTLLTCIQKIYTDVCFKKCYRRKTREKTKTLVCGF